jgi:hypothetical protein
VKGKGNGPATRFSPIPLGRATISELKTGSTQWVGLFSGDIEYLFQILRLIYRLGRGESPILRAKQSSSED